MRNGRLQKIEQQIKESDHTPKRDFVLRVHYEEPSKLPTGEPVSVAIPAEYAEPIFRNTLPGGTRVAVLFPKRSENPSANEVKNG